MNDSRFHSVSVVELFVRGAEVSLDNNNMQLVSVANKTVNRCLESFGLSFVQRS